MRTVNVRHDLDAAAVTAQVASKIEWNEATRQRLTVETGKALASYETATVWSGRKPDPAYIDPMIDAWNAREREHYARVRVIELPQAGKRFILVYGDEDDETVGSGTGPFETLDAATAWFMNGGR